MKNSRFHILKRAQDVHQPIDKVFAFFSDAANLEALTPPWLQFSVVTPRPITLRAGALIDYQLHWRGIPMRWQSLIEVWEPPHRFVDVQVQGPYRLWRHTHTFQEDGGGTMIRDEVHYRLPFGWLGLLAHRLHVRRDLEAVFDYRAQRVLEIFGRPRI